MSKRPYVPIKSHDHDFHPESGWCSHCLTRDDGLALRYDGSPIRQAPRPKTPPASPELDW